MKPGQATRDPKGRLGIVEKYDEAVYFGGPHVKPAIVTVRYPNGDRDTFHPCKLKLVLSAQDSEAREGKP